MSKRSSVSPSVVWIAVCWAALVAMMMCNWLFEYLKLGGVTVPEVANQVFVWFMPSSYVFSIWNVVYAALVIWLVMESPRAVEERSLSRRQTTLFALSCALNVGWLVAFHFQQVAIALVAAMALWIVVERLYVSLRDDVTRSRFGLIPFSLYFALATVAVVTNATNLATRLVAFSLPVAQASTVALTVAMLVVAALSVRNSRDYVFPLVIFWALTGVGVHLMSVDMMHGTLVLAITTAAALATYLPVILIANDLPSRLRAKRRGT